MSAYQQEVDARGLNCPLPLRARESEALARSPR